MSKGKSTTTTTTDPTQMAIYEDLYGKAKGIAQQPFVPYTGGRVAGFNPDQLAGFDATRNMFGQSMSFDPRGQLNSLASMSAPSVNLPFSFMTGQSGQPQQQPQPTPMPGGTPGGRPPQPPSIGGIGGGGPVMPSPSSNINTPQSNSLLGGQSGQPTLIYDGNGNVNVSGGGGVKYDSVGMPLVNDSFGLDQELPPGFVAPDFTLPVTTPTISSDVGISKTPLTGNNPPQTEQPIYGGNDNPFAPTQLGPAAMQKESIVKDVEKFAGADTSPVDLYSGTSINRGDVRDIKPQSLLNTDLGAYQNPFESQVIDNTLGDLNRARQLQLQSDQDAAIGRGAFGGSRSALLESETNRSFAEQAAKTAGDLRAQGFDRATSLAGQDIGRQFAADKYMSDADRAIAMQNATFGQQAGLSGMNALNTAAMQGAQFKQDAGMAGAAAVNRASSQQAGLDASRYGADQDAINRYGLQQGQFNNEMNMGKFDAATRAAFMQPELDMRNRQFQAGLLSGQLSDQYRNLGLLSGIGTQQQGLGQAGLDAGYGEFMRAIGYGPQQLGLLAQGVSALPSQGSTTSSNKPGTLDQLAQAAAIYSGFGF
tara:strand:- start:600 stop:2378 length:1779 start_codon:yes stop_codon:yes gene_type:complete